MRHARPADTPAIYELLERVQFACLPEYEQAKPIIERSHGLVFERDGKVVMFVSLYLLEPEKLALDVAVAPEWQGKVISRGLCKQVLTYCHSLTDSLYVEAYNPRAVKLALLLGFEMTDSQERDGYVTLALRKRD